MAKGRLTPLQREILGVLKAEGWSTASYLGKKLGYANGLAVGGSLAWLRARGLADKRRVYTGRLLKFGKQYFSEHFTLWDIT